MTGSRSGMVSFVFFLFLVWISGKKKILWALGFAAFLALVWYFMPETYQLRYKTVYDDQINATATASAEGRKEGFKAGMRLFSTHPILGVGMGNYMLARSIEVDGIKARAHNLYGQLAAELGLLGILGFLYYIYNIFKNRKAVHTFYKQIKPSEKQISYNLSLACVQVVWLLLFNGIFGHNLYRYNWLWIAAICVLCLHFITQKERENSDTFKNKIVG